MSFIRARARVLARAAALRRESVAPSATPVRAEGCRIEDAAGLICDAACGKYPHKTQLRDETERALAFFGRVVGNDTLWADIDESHYTKALRIRLEELLAKGCRGFRACEITISRVVTVVGWLREQKHIPRDAAPWPKRFKELIRQHWKGIKGTVRDPEPFRPRHTHEEVLKIMAAATFDPRLDMLLACGAELRLGQVARCLRSDLDLPPVDFNAPETIDTDYGTLRVVGSGKKGGTIVDLTRGQRQRIDDVLTAGYLVTLEQRRLAGEIADYALFPAGYVVGRVGFTRGQSIARTLSEKIDHMKPVTGSWIRKNWRDAEKRAGVPHIKGRCAYGARRQGRDVADVAGLSRSAIENYGGWAPGSNIADAVYRDRENRVGRREARKARALFRGEAVA